VKECDGVMPSCDVHITGRLSSSLDCIVLNGRIISD
jgi:hypothetical protein